MIHKHRPKAFPLTDDFLLRLSHAAACLVPLPLSQVAEYRLIRANQACTYVCQLVLREGHHTHENTAEIRSQAPRTLTQPMAISHTPLPEKSSLPRQGLGVAFDSAAKYLSRRSCDFWHTGSARASLYTECFPSQSVEQALATHSLPAGTRADIDMGDRKLYDMACARTARDAPRVMMKKSSAAWALRFPLD